MTVVAFVTCVDIPDLEPDDRIAATALEALDISVEAAVWDDPAVDWSRFDLAVVRSTWDYSPRRDAYLAWARSVPHLANNADTIVWNTDKRYLEGLGAAGVPIVPTTWITPGDQWVLPPAGAGSGSSEFVIKPAVSAGSRDTGRYDMSDPTDRKHAEAHIDRICDTRRTIMIQPYLTAVDTYGETALIFFGGEFSHAIRKGPMLTGPDLGMRGLYQPEAITARDPSPAEMAVAAEVLAAMPDLVGTPLYARVDLIPGVDGSPMLVELELTEPSLFFEHASAAPARFAAAVSAMIEKR